MTLSRGPWLGGGAGFLIARVGLAKKKRLAIVVSLLLFTVGGVIAHRRTAEYAKLAREDAAGTIALGETKSSAAYRTRLYNIYKPIAEEGGWFGWSSTAYPRAFAKHP
jgi:hypothetical protein